MEHFLQEHENCYDRTQGFNQIIIRKEPGLSNCVWGSRMTRKLLKLQLMSVLALLWLGVAVYGCDFPVKVFLNQMMMSLYFGLIYCVGLAASYYVMHASSVCGMRIVSGLQVMTIISSGLFEYLCFQSLTENSQKDRNPLTRIWASSLYAAIIIANGLISGTAFGLSYQGFTSSCKIPLRSRRIPQDETDEEPKHVDQSAPEEV